MLTLADNIGAALLVFVNAAISDFLEAKYVLAVNEKNADKASAYSMAMWLMSVIGLLAVLEVGWWVLAPEGLGLYVGTKIAMRAPAG